jgi:tetratricopeptide (TPR) repeat protein
MSIKATRVQRNSKAKQTILTLSHFNKYVVQNIMLKFAIDSTGLYRWDDARAAKVAGHELKGLTCYANANVTTLHLPLMCLVDYRGFRLVAVSMLPLSKSSLVLGSGDGARTVSYDVANGAAELNAMLERAAANLNLAAHLVGPTADSLVRVWTAVDVEGHKGSDGRYYLLDFARTMPPVFPRLEVRERRPNSHLYELFRPEFVNSFPKPLCSDGFSRFLSLDPERPLHNRTLRVATIHLFERTIPDFARGELLPQAREAGLAGTLHEYRLVQVMHRSGINARYLGMVFRHVPESERECRMLVLIEALARQCKNNLRHRLRRTMEQKKVPLEQPYRAATLRLLNLIFGQSADATEYHRLLKRQIRANFELELSAAEDELPLRKLISSHASPNLLPGPQLLFQRIVEATGIVFTSRGYSKLSYFSVGVAANWMLPSAAAALGQSTASTPPASSRGRSRSPTPSSASLAVPGAAAVPPLATSPSSSSSSSSSLLSVLTSSSPRRSRSRERRRRHQEQKQQQRERERELAASNAMRRDEKLALSCNPSERAWRLAKPFDDTDLQEIGARVKHMGIMASALGDRFLLQGLMLMPRRPEASPSFFERAIRHYSEALDSNPNNVAVMKRCAQASERLLRVVSRDHTRIAGQFYDNSYDKSSPLGRQTLQLLMRINDIDPSCPFSLRHTAKFFDRCGDLEQAEDFYLRAIEADITYHEAYISYSAFLRDWAQKRARQFPGDAAANAMSAFAWQLDSQFASINSILAQLSQHSSLTAEQIRKI